MRHRCAFTLIELLVVISIIVLLIAMLLPSLARARHQARSTVCLSNLRSVGVSLYSYANENRDRMPGTGLAHGGSGSNVQGAWFFLMRKLYGDDIAPRCPADESAFWDSGFPPNNVLRRVSYGINYYTAGRIGKRLPIDKLSNIKTPAATIWLGELAEKGPFAVADHVHPETWFSNPKPLASQELQLERHLKRSNYLLLDGHGENMVFEDTYSINKAASRFPNIAWIHNKWDPLVAR